MQQNTLSEAESAPPASRGVLGQQESLREVIEAISSELELRPQRRAGARRDSACRARAPARLRRVELPHDASRERAEALGGRLEGESAPGQGTEVRARLPRAAAPEPSA